MTAAQLAPGRSIYGRSNLTAHPALARGSLKRSRSFYKSFAFLLHGPGNLSPRLCSKDTDLTLSML
jgi:hypothetical protein